MKSMFFLLLVFTAPIFGQCDLSIKDSPVIRGLQLGMTIESVNRVVTPFHIDDSSALSATLSAPELSKIAGFQDVISLHLSFVRPNQRFAFQLTHLSLDYDQTQFEWKSIEAFTRSVSDSLKLRFRDFSILGNIAVLQCNEFSIGLQKNRIDLYAKEISSPIELLPPPTKPFKP